MCVNINGSLKCNIDINKGGETVIYRTNPRNQEQLSQLGFGCMRFNKDDREVEKQIAYAVEMA